MLTTSLRTRPLALPLVAALTLAAAPAGRAQTEQPGRVGAELQLRVYDVGDLPAHNGDAQAPPVETGAYIAGELGLPSFAMGPGLLAVRAEPEQHDSLAGRDESHQRHRGVGSRRQHKVGVGREAAHQLI